MPTPVYVSAAPDWGVWANVQAVGKNIHDLLIAAGWTNTADSGQVDWTGGAPAGGTTVYELLQPGDSQQATHPIIVKFEYTLAAASVGKPEGWFTVGTSSNGSGVITGVASARTKIYNWGSGSATAADCYFAAGASWFAFLTYRATNFGAALIFERSLDSTGAYTDEYVYYGWAAQNSTAGCQVITKTGNKTPSETNWNYVLTTATSGILGSTMVWSPVFPLLGKLGQPQTVAGVCKLTDQPIDGSITTVNVYGSSHTYRVNANSGPTSNLVANLSFCLRYD